MKERPILFSAPMVRAILDGRKTQTRRLVKAADLSLDPCSHDYAVKGETLTEGGKFGAVFWGDRGASKLLPCPYGQPGDRLWVRETWRSWESNCYGEHRGKCGEHCHQTYVAYAATPRIGFRAKPDRARICYLDESTPLEANKNLLGPWKPSIHIPRAYSRILLDVTALRVERLQAISEEDARAEGVKAVKGGMANVSLSAREMFACLWDQINAKRAPWSSNPWVWVVAFRVLP